MYIKVLSPREAESLSLHPAWTSNSSGVHLSLQRGTNIFSNPANKYWIDRNFLKNWTGSFVKSFFVTVLICFYSPTTWLFLFITLFFLLLWKTTCLSPGNCRIYAKSCFFKDISIQKFSGGYCSPLMCVVLSAKIRKSHSVILKDQARSSFFWWTYFKSQSLWIPVFPLYLHAPNSPVLTAAGRASPL